MAQVSVDAPLERLFQQFIVLRDCEEATPVNISDFSSMEASGIEELVVDHIIDESQERWTRVRLVEAISYDDEVTFSAPELYFHPRRPDFDENMLDCGIEELFGPGNAVVWCRYKVDSAYRQMMALHSAVSNKFGDCHRCGEEATCRLRWVMRRDGSRGCFVAWMPYHPETGELVPFWADCFAGICHIEPHNDTGTKTAITCLEAFPAMPSWAESLAVPRILQLRQGFWEQEQSVLVETAYGDVLSAAADYIIVGIRKCSRGGPLLPVRKANGLDWVQWQSFSSGSKCNLSEYLTDFCARLGVMGATFHSNYLGWHLVPYQAAVLRSEWEAAWPHLMQPFQDQRSAFRRLRGGRVAPELMQDVLPRYFTPALTEDKSDTASVSTTDESCASSVSQRSSETECSAIRSTFVHFINPQTALRRSGSWHAMPAARNSSVF